MPNSARIAEAPVDDLFLERWSRRAISPRPLPEDVVQSLFEAARWAPSASNLQPWLFIFNDDAETLARGRALILPRNRIWAERAPLLVFIFARRRHPETGQPLRTGAFDAGAAWLSLALQAHKLGLTVRAMGGIEHDRTYAAFGVPPQDFESMTAVAIGAPAPAAELPPEFAAREIPSGRHSSRTFAFRGRFVPAPERDRHAEPRPAVAAP